MGKPVRRLRRFIRRNYRKGKGKGKDNRHRFKGKGGYYTYLTELPPDEVESLYKGMSKAKGKGRRQHPAGPDGKPMECWDCGSTQHFHNDPRCPSKGRSKGKSKGGYCTHEPPSGTQVLATWGTPSAETNAPLQTALHYQIAEHPYMMPSVKSLLKPSCRPG